MNKAIAAATFAIVAAAMYFLCGNAHIDIFPCDKAMARRDAIGTRIEKSTGTCSLLAHNQGTQSDGSYARLSGAGWATLAAFCGGIGLLAGLGVGFATRRIGATAS